MARPLCIDSRRTYSAYRFEWMLLLLDFLSSYICPLEFCDMLLSVYLCSRGVDNNKGSTVCKQRSLLLAAGWHFVLELSINTIAALLVPAD